MSTATKSALTKFDRSYCRHDESYRNLHFTDMGKSRLHHTIGFIQAMQACGKEDEAEKMAKDLDRSLSNLNQYGGYEDEIEGDGKFTPRFRVVLGDDGTFGGFTLGWYKLVTKEEWGKLIESNRQDSNEQWDWYMQRVCEKANIRQELKVWTTGGYRHYAYCFNGGLLFHGYGNDPLAVNLGSSSVLWSVHT